MTLRPALGALFSLPLLGLLVVLAFFAPGPAAADERIGTMAAALESAGNGTGGAVLNATFEFELPPPLEEAVQRGVALYFTIDFELYRKRWYWLDPKVSSSALTYRLSSSPLTRTYKLARGGLSQTFESLDEALALLKSVRQWKVIEKGQLRPNEEYEAQVRMRLDVSQLPKPFQVNAITSREWSLASDWREVPVPAGLAR